MSPTLASEAIRVNITVTPELREAADRLHETLWKGMSAPQIDFLRAMLRKVAENQKQADTCEASR